MLFKGHKIIVIGDAHDSPNIKQDRFKWIGKYIKESEPDYIIQIGDWASFDSLSFFQKNSSQAGKLKDAFIPPKPFNSWTLNEDTCLWEPPIPYPNDGKLYNWNAPNQSWHEIQ